MKHQLEDIPIATHHSIRVIPVFLILDLNDKNILLFNNVIRRLISTLRNDPFCLERMMLSILLACNERVKTIVPYDELSNILIPEITNNIILEDPTSNTSNTLNNLLDKKIIRTAGFRPPKIIILTNKSEFHLQLDPLWNKIADKIILTDSEKPKEFPKNFNIIQIPFDEADVCNYLIDYLIPHAEVYS